MSPSPLFLRHCAAVPEIGEEIVDREGPPDGDDQGLLALVGHKEEGHLLQLVPAAAEISNLYFHFHLKKMKINNVKLSV